MSIANQINVLDPNSMAGLKRLARDNSPDAVRAAAQQFEALMLQMVLKSMRDATPMEGMFDSEQSRMYQGVLDQQLAMNMAQSGGMGLTDVLVRQLGGSTTPAAPSGGDAGAGTSLAGVVRQAAIPAGLQSLPELAEGLAARRAAARAAEAADRGAGADAASAAPRAAPGNAADLEARPLPGKVPASAREFVDRMWPHALEASRETGIPARFLIAHAALETGWGRAELRHADGRQSFNLFNVKAGKRWAGDTVATGTTEYAQGRAYTEQARFRSYGSYAEAFRDYAKLLTGSPRYAEVLGQREPAGFARGLQKAGYATDPMYADKLERVIGGKTLRTALSSVKSPVA